MEEGLNCDKQETTNSNMERKSRKKRKGKEKQDIKATQRMRDDGDCGLEEEKEINESSGHPE